MASQSSSSRTPEDGGLLVSIYVQYEKRKTRISCGPKKTKKNSGRGRMVISQNVFPSRANQSPQLQMTDLSAEPSAILAKLTSSCALLESVLSPLHSRSWSDTTESLSTLDRAKLDILLADAINDLVWGERLLSCSNASTADVDEQYFSR